MPELGRFYGIVIQMCTNDHPPPHFHAIYGGHRAVVGIHDLAVLHGFIPPRALRLVRQWAREHREEVWRAWEMAQSGIQPAPIDPLP